MPKTYWAIVCPHKPPKVGLRVIHPFTISVEATPKCVQERARKRLALLSIDPDDQATMRIVPCKSSTHKAIQAEPDRACEMRDGLLCVVKRPSKNPKNPSVAQLLSALQLWAHDTLTGEQQAVIKKFIKRMRTL